MSGPGWMDGRSRSKERKKFANDGWDLVDGISHGMFALIIYDIVLLFL